MNFIKEHYGTIKGLSGLVKYCELNGINSIHDIPICQAKECNNPVTYNKAYPNKGFASFCSPECSRKSKTINDEIEGLLRDKEWLYNQRYILKKSKENIANELGISISPVNKWLKIHQFPDIRYNESDYKIKRILENKVELQDLYSSGDQLHLIAKKLGTSTSTLSIFMRKHGIEMRPSNSYERKKNFISTGEREVFDFLIGQDITVIQSDRSVIGKELDIHMPDHKLAIEFNGLYWHSEEHKPKDIHIEKTNLCEEKGIELFHIWEDDWNSKRSIVMSMILHKLNKSPFKIGARKCTIKKVSGSDARKFLEENHLQGYSSSSKNLGLYYNEDLVSLMTFNKPRFNKSIDWELVRFANKINTSVVGAFSKLFRSFVSENEGSIVTYADRCYSQGNVYESNGFKLYKINPPSYWYVVDNGSKKVSRTHFIKSKLKDFDQSMSEKEIVDLIGIKKIWNSGTKTYYFNK